MISDGYPYYEITLTERKTFDRFSIVNHAMADLIEDLILIKVGLMTRPQKLADFVLRTSSYEKEVLMMVSH